MERVARALEAVEGERLERVGGRDLVDDEHTAARPRHARQLGDDELRARDVVQRAHRRGKVERGVRGNGSTVAVPLDELDVREQRGRSRASASSSGTGSTPTTSRTSGASASASAPAPRSDVERALVASRLDERAHLLGEPAARSSWRAAKRSAVRTNRSGVDDDTPCPRRRAVDAAEKLVVDRAGDACMLLGEHAVVRRVRPAFRPAGRDRARRRTRPSRRSRRHVAARPPTRTCVPVRSRRKPSAYPTGTIPIHVVALGDEAAAVAGALARAAAAASARAWLVHVSTGSRPSSAGSVPKGERP